MNEQPVAFIMPDDDVDSDGGTTLVMFVYPSGYVGFNVWW